MEIVPVEYDVSSMFHDLVNMISQRAMDKNLSLVVEIEHEIPSASMEMMCASARC